MSMSFSFQRNLLKQFCGDRRRWTVGGLLWLDYPKTAFSATVASIVTLHYATSFSFKNWKWRAVAWGSLPACGIACYVHRAKELVDDERAYTTHLNLQLVLHGVEIGWSVLLWIIIGLAFLPKHEEIKGNK